MIPDHSGSAGAGTTGNRMSHARSAADQEAAPSSRVASSFAGPPSGAENPVGATVCVSLLGEIALSRDGVAGRAAVPGARARLLIAALATHPGRSRSAQALIGEVWGDQPPRVPMNALHTQVSRLRSALPEGALEAGPAGYRLILAEEQIDLTLARRLERRARELHAAGDDRACLDLVDRARSLWRGEPAADLPPGPVAEELADLAATRWAALDELELASREASGDLDGAVRMARRIAAARPLDEPAHGLLMRLLAASGRGNEALEIFAAMRARLADELGADPGPALIELNAAILRGEPMTAPRPPGTAHRAASEPPRPGFPHAGLSNAGSRQAGASSPGPVQGGAENPEAQQGGSSNTGSAQGGSMSAETWQTWAPNTGATQGSSADAEMWQTGAPWHGGTTSSAAPSPNTLSTNVSAPAAIGLRAAPNPLLGRDADLGALLDLLHASRVTTVLGPGGTGKTRVANELGLRAAAGAAVALIELASVRAAPEDARVEVEAAISAALGVAEVVRDATGLRSRKIDGRQRLRDAVAARPMLLILDNCEHLIDGVAEVVADLIGACDRLTVLTTSRAPLEITAETVYPLPPLAIDAHGSPATELFESRARAVRPSVRLDPVVVARLCRTLDGLPLAIELAAARARTMSVEEIDARLEHRFTLLRSGDRTSPQRHRTLHAVIEWSWNLLGEPQRIALRRLCRFPAGFTFAAAQIVADGPEVGDIAAAVDGLVSQSLLSVLEDELGGTRYRMLETVREFGEEQLAAAGEAELVMDRMARWARDFAVDAYCRYTAREQVGVVFSVATELDNLLAVLRQACDTDDAETVYTVFPLPAVLWAIRGAHAELIGWLPRVSAVPPPPARAAEPFDNLQLGAHAMLGLHLMFANAGMREIATLRIRLRRLLRTSTALSRGSRFVGELMCAEPTPARVTRKLAEGVRSDDHDIRWTALLLRANIRENGGDVRGSMRDAQSAMRELDPGDVWGTAMLFQHMAQLTSQIAHYREAAAHYRRAVDALQQLRSFDEISEFAAYMAVSLIGAGDLEQARWELEMAAGYIDGDAGPDDPVLRPNHRRAAVQVGWSELALAQGEIEAGLRRARQVLELYAWPVRAQFAGPGMVMVAAGVLDSHVLYGGLDAVPSLPQELVDITRDQLAQYIDLPQIGSVALALGSYLLATDRFPDLARELIALAPKTTARQDSPSMRIERHLAHHGAVVADDLMAEPRRRAAKIGRRAAGRRIMALLEQISGQVQ
ncbi:AfsR/SARP family transcriptional regulator [Nocardia albiluteola]|nr:BTAD domain-containing putative transcriptional regulator [Nocardia albiluteola]